MGIENEEKKIKKVIFKKLPAIIGKIGGICLFVMVFFINISFFLLITPKTLNFGHFMLYFNISRYIQHSILGYFIDWSFFSPEIS